MRGSRRGFTLVELLVVITIIGMLVGMTLPAVMSVRENGRKTACAVNLKNIMLAMLAYESKNLTFPPGRVGCDGDGDTGGKACQNRDGTPLTLSQQAGTSAFVLILPELDSTTLYTQFGGFKNGAVFPGSQAFSSAQGGSGAGSPTAWRTSTIQNAVVNRPPVFVCASDTASQTTTGGAWGVSMGVSSYAMSMGTLGPANLPNIKIGTSTTARKATGFDIKYRNDGAFIYRKGFPSNEFIDGLGYTIFLGETIDGHAWGNRNRWCIAWAYQDSLRGAGATFNPNPKASEGTSWTMPSAAAAAPGASTSTPEDRYGRAFISRHPNGMNMAFGDGHTQFITNKIRDDPDGGENKVFRALSTRADIYNYFGEATLNVTRSSAFDPP